jgi:hypothetical protein
MCRKAETPSAKAVLFWIPAFAGMTNVDLATGTNYKLCGQKSVGLQGWIELGEPVLRVFAFVQPKNGVVRNQAWTT